MRKLVVATVVAFASMSLASPPVAAFAPVVTDISLVATVSSVVRTCTPQCHSFGVIVVVAGVEMFVDCQTDNECVTVEKEDCIAAHGSLSSLVGDISVEATELFTVLDPQECEK